MGLLSHRMDISCDVDLERSLDSFHAYAVPDGIEIGPGDVVIVQGLPNRLAFGENRRLPIGRRQPFFVPVCCENSGRNSPPYSS